MLFHKLKQYYNNKIEIVQSPTRMFDNAKLSLIFTKIKDALKETEKERKGGEEKTGIILPGYGSLLKKQLAIIRDSSNEKYKSNGIQYALWNSLIEEGRILAIDGKELCKSDNSFKENYFKEKDILFRRKDGLILRHLRHNEEDVNAAIKIAWEGFGEEAKAVENTYKFHIGLNGKKNKSSEDEFIIEDKGGHIVGVLGNYSRWWWGSNIAFCWVHLMEDVDMEELHKAIVNKLRDSRKIIIEMVSNNVPDFESKNIEFLGNIPRAYDNFSAVFFEFKKRKNTCESIYALKYCSNIRPYLLNSMILPYKEALAEYFVLELDKKIVGISGIYTYGWRPHSVMWGGWGAVTEKFRRKGLHSFSIDCRIRIAKQHGFKAYVIETSSNLKKAIKSYLKNGFSPQYKIKDFYGSGYDYILFTKII